MCFVTFFFLFFLYFTSTKNITETKSIGEFYRNRHCDEDIGGFNGGFVRLLPISGVAVTLPFTLLLHSLRSLSSYTKERIHHKLFIRHGK
jgi:hypothetical protein